MKKITDDISEVLPETLPVEEVDPGTLEATVETFAFLISKANPNPADDNSIKIDPLTAIKNEKKVNSKLKMINDGITNPGPDRDFATSTSVTWDASAAIN